MASFFMQERVKTICHPPPAADWRSDLNIKIQVSASRSYLHNGNEETKLY